VFTGDALVRVNKSLFGRACINLLMNAIQHCAEGSTITVSITHEDDQVRVAVANPGAPIESAVLDHLFDRFYRAEVSRTNSRENHGLGLAIVKATAEMHGGKVFATSVGGINTFAFSVAASRGGQQDSPGTPTATPSAGVQMEPASASH
jgi:two-component system heavy metal sensor histidine kinase CusS